MISLKYLTKFNSIIYLFQGDHKGLGRDHFTQLRVTILTKF